MTSAAHWQPPVKGAFSLLQALWNRKTTLIRDNEARIPELCFGICNHKSIKTKEINGVDYHFYRRNFEGGVENGDFQNGQKYTAIDMAPCAGRSKMRCHKAIQSF